MSPPIGGRLGGLLASAILVAATTGLVTFLQPHHLMPYALVVMAVAVGWGTGLAALAAVLSVAAYDYFYVPPLHSLAVSNRESGATLVVFLVTSVVVGELAARLRRAALTAGRVSEEQAALRRVATLVARAVPPDLMFAAVAEEVGALFGADATAIWRFEPDGDLTLVGGHGLEHLQPGWRGRPHPRLAVASVQASGRAARLDLGDSSARLACPIVVEDRVWGAIGVELRRHGLLEDTERRMAEFTELVATAIANAETRAALAASRARIVATADQVRSRLERDLHDGAQQRLVSLALELRTAQAALPPEAGEVVERLDGVAAGLTAALEELREMAAGIHPAVLAKGGLRPALRALARRCPLPVDLHLDVEGRLPEPVEVAAYYVVSEALTNVAKYAGASSARVEVEVRESRLCVGVSDDGVGGADLSRGSGLLGLKDRTEALGGTMLLRSPAGAGTSLQIELPLADHAPL